jgi:hypothetical protein
MAAGDEQRMRRIELLAQLQALNTRIDELASQFSRKPPQEMTHDDVVHDADLNVEIGGLTRERDALYRALDRDDLWPGDVLGAE